MKRRHVAGAVLAILAATAVGVTVNTMFWQTFVNVI